MYERTVFSATEMDPFASILACKRNVLGVSLSSNINLDQPTQSPFSDVGPNALCTPCASDHVCWDFSARVQKCTTNTDGSSLPPPRVGGRELQQLNTLAAANAGRRGAKLTLHSRFCNCSACARFGVEKLPGQRGFMSQCRAGDNLHGTTCLRTKDGRKGTLRPHGFGDHAAVPLLSVMFVFCVA